MKTLDQVVAELEGFCADQYETASEMFEVAKGLHERANQTDHEKLAIAHLSFNVGVLMGSAARLKQIHASLEEIRANQSTNTSKPLKWEPPFETL